ncbi:carboxylesterase type B [Providencia alcalifaciens]|nr:carboxylesterase type B [Providencia alcalifaciens]
MFIGKGKITLTALFFLFLSVSPAQAVPLTIETSAGTVKGEIQQALAVWIRIPYGKAPTGELRWQKPQLAEVWNGVFDATQPAANCIQPSKTGPIGVEDCLNLNIYRPNNDEANLPVLYYIHGGNNQMGTSAEFDPQSAAISLNAVIVTVNHRLGALGFNPLSALNTGAKLQDSGNFALLDIKLSLDWIKGNIAQFGGNPNNITISGFSAGGRDVMAMLISPISKIPLIRR